MKNSTISSNTGNGVFIYTGGTLWNCVISCNNAGVNSGGGIRYNNTTPDSSFLYNCLINDNRAAAYGGIYGDDGATLWNCTIAGNYATNITGGIGFVNDIAGLVANCVVYSNIVQNGSCPNWTNEVNTVVFTNCCTSPTNNLPGTGNIDNSPQFINSVAGNYRMASGSPCINAGLNQNWMINAVDLDGRRRIRYDTVDIGAYEVLFKGAIFSFR